MAFLIVTKRNFDCLDCEKLWQWREKKTFETGKTTIQLT